MVLSIAGNAQAGAVTASERIKVIVDQDARGPCSTDMQSILMFAQSPQVEVLGITIVSGDLWMDQETLHTLRALEIAGRSDIPVYRGAVFQQNCLLFNGGVRGGRRPPGCVWGGRCPIGSPLRAPIITVTRPKICASPLRSAQNLKTDSSKT